MHKFLRAVGFSMYQKRQEVEALLEELAKNTKERHHLSLGGDTQLWELRAEMAPDMGVALVGEIDSEGVFHREYYYPYLRGKEISSVADCSIQRHTEKETFAGLLDEYKVGISLIYYLDNSFEYQERRLRKASRQVESVALTGLSVEGKVLLPLHKTQKQIELAKVTSKDRNSLLEAAKNGDEDAMETLTIEDIDIYSRISRRVGKEDIYSIIDTSFMPCGIECDQYAVVGEICHVEEKENQLTGEVVYDLTLNCNDLIFHVAIGQKDLLGEPVVGRRFKGQIWMQGIATFKEEE